MITLIHFEKACMLSDCEKENITTFGVTLANNEAGNLRSFDKTSFFNILFFSFFGEHSFFVGGEVCFSMHNVLVDHSLLADLDTEHIGLYIDMFSRSTRGGWSRVHLFSWRNLREHSWFRSREKILHEAASDAESSQCWTERVAGLQSNCCCCSPGAAG